MSEAADDRKLASTPYQLGTTLYRFDLDGADDAITLPPGGYTLSLDGTGRAILRLGAVAAAPADKGNVANSTVMDPGTEIFLRLEAETALHGILPGGGAATLYATRLP